MTKLRKYKLKNIGKAKEIISPKLPHGRVSVDKITDAEAEILYNNGKSHYIELASASPEKAADKK